MKLILFRNFSKRSIWCCNKILGWFNGIT